MLVQKDWGEAEEDLEVVEAENSTSAGVDYWHLHHPLCLDRRCLYWDHQDHWVHCRPYNNMHCLAVRQQVFLE